MNEVSNARELVQPAEGSASSNINEKLFDESYPVYSNNDKTSDKGTISGAAADLFPSAIDLFGPADKQEKWHFNGDGSMQLGPYPAFEADKDLMNGALDSVLSISENPSQEARQKLLDSLKSLTSAEKAASKDEDDDRLKNLQDLGKKNGFSVRANADGGFEIKIGDGTRGNKDYTISVDKNGNVANVESYLVGSFVGASSPAKLSDAVNALAKKSGKHQ